VVAEKLLGGHRVRALAALLVRGRDAIDHRVRRPRLVGRPLFAGTGHDLELGDRGGSLPDRRAQAVGAGVSAADDDDVLTGGRDLVGHRLTERCTVRLRQILHRLVDARKLTSGHGKIAAYGRADREYDGVIAFAQRLPREVLSDRHTGPEHRALALHLVDPAIDLHL